MLLDHLSEPTLMLIVGFVGLRKVGEMQSSRDERDNIFRKSSHERREIIRSPTSRLEGHLSRSTKSGRPEDLTDRTNPRNGLYTHRCQDSRTFGNRPGAITPATPPPIMMPSLRVMDRPEGSAEEFEKVF